MLEAQKHEERALEIINRLRDLAAQPAVTAPQVAALRAALEGHLRLLNKCLPDLKSVQLEAHVGMTHEAALRLLE